MPGWHDATAALSDRIGTLGIVQEQHPERARLFMQWRQMDWPILVDAFDLLEVQVVPLTLLVDADGVVREIVRSREGPREIVERFLDELTPLEPAAPSLRPLDPDVSLDALAARLEREPEDAWAWFRTGVAQRRLYDTGSAGAEPFAAAVEAWSKALELDPDNYIARRRLQQFGPRLDKPYPFYDWVPEAREAIAARGEQPPALPVEPRGAELTVPLDRFRAADPDEEPDPLGRIRRDEGFVSLRAVAVPPRPAPGSSVRVHLELRPVAERDAHWNNEVDGVRFWFAADGAAVDRRSLKLPLPPEPVSDEPRRAELELQLRDAAATLNGYALYYVCEGVQGQCLYRRQDFVLRLSSAS